MHSVENGMYILQRKMFRVFLLPRQTLSYVISNFTQYRALPRLYCCVYGPERVTMIIIDQLPSVKNLRPI